MRLGEVSLSKGDVEYLKFTSTVIPFVAVVGAVVVGYLLIRPTLQDIRYVIGIAKTFFPALRDNR